MIKGYWTLEALVALIIFLSIVSVLPKFNPNLDQAVVYKEASDISQVILETDSLDNPVEIRLFLELVNPSLGVIVEHNGSRISVNCSGQNRIVLVRPRFSDGKMEDVKFTFCY